VANAESVHGFSATAWFFAQRLEQELDCPVGVIAADWGGTPAEAWTSASALAPFSAFAPALEALARLAADPEGARAVHETRRGVWGRTVAQQDPLSAAHAEAPGFDDSAWSTLAVPGRWSGELERFDGLVWLRRTVEIPAGWAGRELALELGAIDDDDRTWFEGEPVGATEGWNVPRRYRVPPELVRAGRATIAVRVLDTGGHGGFTGEAADLRLGPAAGGESLALAGAWRAARGAALAELPAKPDPFELGGSTPSALFNGMIAPLAGLRLAGFLWYQGESNLRRADEYRELFPALIRDWRSRFGAELPFLFVQIAPFAYGADRGEAGDLRAAQAAAQALPRTGMVATIDVGDPHDIHPKDKRTVGRRLACLALELAYGRPPAEAPPPLPRAARFEAQGGAVVVEFSAEVEVCGPSAFEVAGPDGEFRAAPEVEAAGREVRIASPGVPRPARVRYGWSAAGGPGVRGRGSPLPIPPFRLEVP
jgi:sialate O-acetylesterase